MQLVVCTALGVDMYDCVYPCRTARFGTALVPEGELRLKKHEFATDFRPIDATCTCPVCRQYTRAFLYTCVAQETVGAHLVTLHNMHYMKRLMREVREAILQDAYPAYVQAFLDRQYPSGHVPDWVRDALLVAGMTLRAPDPALAPPAASAAAAAEETGDVPPGPKRPRHSHNHHHLPQ